MGPYHRTCIGLKFIYIVLGVELIEPHLRRARVVRIAKAACAADPHLDVRARAKVTDAREFVVQRHVHERLDVLLHVSPRPLVRARPLTTVPSHARDAPSVRHDPRAGRVVREQHLLLDPVFSALLRTHLASTTLGVSHDLPVPRQAFRR